MGKISREITRAPRIFNLKNTVSSLVFIEGCYALTLGKLITALEMIQILCGALKAARLWFES